MKFFHFFRTIFSSAQSQKTQQGNETDYDYSPAGKHVVVISSADNTNGNFGTGFLIHQTETSSICLTCFHVVDDVGEDNIRVEGDCPAKVLWKGNREEDLAVIQIQRSFPEIRTYKIYKQKIDPGTTIDVDILGHKLHERKSYPGTDGNGKISSYTLHGKAKKETMQLHGKSGFVPTWDITIDKDEDSSLEKGYSGSPVIDGQGFVIGVLFEKSGTGRKGTAISLEYLFDVSHVIDGVILYEPISGDDRSSLLIPQIKLNRQSIRKIDFSSFRFEALLSVGFETVSKWVKLSLKSLYKGASVVIETDTPITTTFTLVTSKSWASYGEKITVKLKNEGHFFTRMVITSTSLDRSVFGRFLPGIKVVQLIDAFSINQNNIEKIIDSLNDFIESKLHV